MATDIEEGVLVQQLDDDLPVAVAYGRALNFRPVVALLAITTDGPPFGLLGSSLAVPCTAVVVNMVAAARDYRAGNPEEKLVAA